MWYSGAPMRYLLALTFVPGALIGCGGGGGGNADAPIPIVDGASSDGALPPDAMPPAKVVQCPTPVPAPATGICDATPGTGTARVVRGDVLADGTVYADGEVLYDGNLIVCVGCDCSAAAGYATAARIECAGAAVSPSLINAHDHLNYNNRAPLASTADGGTRYEHRHDWRGGVPTPSNQHGTGTTSAGMRWNELRHLFSGTTGIAASTRADGLIRNYDEPEGRDFALGLTRVQYEVFMLGDGNETFQPDCGWSFAFSEFQVSLFPDVVTHTAEGINDYAHEEFRCQSSSMMGARDFTESNVGHIHGVGLTTTDYYNMARDGARLVWSPRSNISLYGNTADAPVFARLGGVIALGTDWTYSGSANLVREMACAQSLSRDQYGGAFTAEDIWRMATRNGAIAMGADAMTGTLAADKLADLAVYRPSGERYHQAVIDSDSSDVAFVIRDGDLLYAEADVATALGDACDPVDVCGDARVVCASRELAGQTFAQIEAAVSGAPAAYPAIFCDVPANEPTCIPSRPGEYTGPSGADPDGDGVAAGDNCPTIFNPIRPMDMGAQPDLDADGMGDACDPNPLAADLDADGVANTADLCPFVANPAPQLDMDGDGKGDACDACPDAPNPIGVCTPTASTIVAVQDGTVPTGSSVYIEGAVVTAIDATGFTAQDPAVTSGQYAGVYVFTGSAPGGAIGDVVSFAGTTEEYFLMTEVSGAAVLSRVPGPPIAPVALTVAEATQEVYEGVLVTLTDVTQVEYPYNCAADNMACMDQRVIRLNGAAGIRGWDRFYGDGQPSWIAEATAALADMTPAVTGVMYYRFDARRIAPRTAADITP